MPTVTLTSDMGRADYYLALLKNALVTQIPDVSIFDISHEVKPFDTRHAAFLLRSAYEHFPVGSIHLLGVNPEWAESQPHVVVHSNGHYFIGADNGVFSLILQSSKPEAFRLQINEQAKKSTFPMLDVFVPTAQHICAGGRLDEIGERMESIAHNQRFIPVVEPFLIKGSVLHVDRYSNLITNISKGTFDEVGEERPYRIIMRTASKSINKVSDHYSDVGAGERVAIFGSHGFLEIALNKGAPGNGGGASTLFGMKEGDIIRVEFDVHADSKNAF